jgi:hypothetical protein
VLCLEVADGIGCLLQWESVVDDRPDLLARAQFADLRNNSSSPAPSSTAVKSP